MKTKRNNYKENYSKRITKTINYILLRKKEIIFKKKLTSFMKKINNYKNN